MRELRSINVAAQNIHILVQLQWEKSVMKMMKYWVRTLFFVVCNRSVTLIYNLMVLFRITSPTPPALLYKNVKQIFLNIDNRNVKYRTRRIMFNHFRFEVLKEHI